MNRMKLRICHLYPDALNLYGDRGNVLCMRRRLLWRGIECETQTLHIGEQKDLSGFDLFFMGGGQDFEQEVLLKDLSGENGRRIRSAIEDGKTFLCICGGYQILGTHYETKDGRVCEFLGAIDLHTVGEAGRLIGNYAFSLDPGTGDAGREAQARRSENGGEADNAQVVVGFENHSGRTWLGKGVRPLGRVLAGYGNNGKDRTEGVRYKNTFGTYSHGPVLPKNPQFADLLISKAIENKYGTAELAPLDDTLETKAQQQVMKLYIK